MVVNERLLYARSIRCGVNGELMLYIVSFKNAGYADSCGWELSRAKGNIKYSRLIMPQKTSKKIIYFVSSEPTCCDRCLLLLAPVANERCGVSTAEGVLLPSALAAAATVLVPSVVTTGH